MHPALLVGKNSAILVQSVLKWQVVGVVIHKALVMLN